jgi:hypothetical protein
MSTILNDNGHMPVTKITVSTAMRARDVSRPRDDQFAGAAEREDAAARRASTPEPPASAPAPDEPNAARRRRRRRA